MTPRICKLDDLPKMRYYHVLRNGYSLGTDTKYHCVSESQLYNQDEPIEEWKKVYWIGLIEFTADSKIEVYDDDMIPQPIDSVWATCVKIKSYHRVDGIAEMRRRFVDLNNPVVFKRVCGH